MRLGLSYRPRWNSLGFTTFDNDEPIIAKRDVETFETSLRGKYNFTNRMGLTIVGRHYVSSVKNKNVYNLKSNGGLLSNTTVNPSDNDMTFNFFNIDMVYTWQIAEGSFINIVWKYSIAQSNQYYQADYFKNLNDTFHANQNNNVSLRVIYFLDYNTLARKRS